MRIRSMSFLLMVSILLLLSASVRPRAAASSDVDAGTAIAEAQNEIAASYNAVVEAEKAGANVTGLLVKLNEAGVLLTKANLAYSVSNFDSALDSANKCRAMLEGFVEDAMALQKAAAVAQYSDFMITVVGSLVGTVVVIFGGFIVWTVLEKRYTKAGGVAD